MMMDEPLPKIEARRPDAILEPEVETGEQNNPFGARSPFGRNGGFQGQIKMLKLPKGLGFMLIPLLLLVFLVGIAFLALSLLLLPLRLLFKRR